MRTVGDDPDPILDRERLQYAVEHQKPTDVHLYRPTLKMSAHRVDLPPRPAVVERQADVVKFFDGQIVDPTDQSPKNSFARGVIIGPSAALPPITIPPSPPLRIG